MPRPRIPAAMNFEHAVDACRLISQHDHISGFTHCFTQRRNRNPSKSLLTTPSESVACQMMLTRNQFEGSTTLKERQTYSGLRPRALGGVGAGAGLAAAGAIGYSYATGLAAATATNTATRARSLLKIFIVGLARVLLYASPRPFP
ncbi:hypothetical protein GY45DRAFT_140771 [Cubamyces sp. BRFM 1775]|nr:hypothetical protein GY45DRAFT_140771 [Cubamyces sp. BRFM 1775]